MRGWVVRVADQHRQLRHVYFFAGGACPGIDAGILQCSGRLWYGQFYWDITVWGLTEFRK